ncbi:hypothetical protein Ndes2526B_g06531 [Nannochloris sp. 'desiccata']
MPSKQDIQRCDAGEVLVCTLPDNVLEVITSHLGARDTGALALTHPFFARYLRSTRRRCVARVADRRQLKQLSQALEKHKALASLNIIFLWDNPSLSDLSYMSQTTKSLELQFRCKHPAKRSLSWLSANIFSSLEHLTLAGQSSRNRRLNVDGQLSVLSGLPSLTDLKLVNLHNDLGLNKLTQLTSLHIVYPNHDADAPPVPCCPVCMTLHEPCWHEYLLEALDKEEVVIGSYISFLPLLKNLTLDFNAQHDEMSFSSIQNHFYWQNPNAFLALESITLLNTVNFNEEYYQIPLSDDEPVMESFNTSGYALWNALTLAMSYNFFPALQHWKLQVETDWSKRNSKTYDFLKRQYGKFKETFACQLIVDEPGFPGDSFLDFFHSRAFSPAFTASEE